MSTMAGEIGMSLCNDADMQIASLHVFLLPTSLQAL